MSADASPEEETRAVLDVGKARLVMMASEDFATVGSDFRAQVATQVDKTAKLEAVAVAKPLLAFAYAPKPTTDQDANLVLATWIAHPDGTVQLVSFYVNNDGARAAAAAWTNLARKIAGTLVPGKRALDIGAGERKLESLQVTVPARWVVTAQPGPDFIVFHLRPLAPLGSSATSGCGVYLGGFPSYQHTQAGIDAKLVHMRKGKLRGADVTWHDWSDGGIPTTEAMTPYSGDTVHVFCVAKTDADLVPLRAMMESLR
jgi:hypothetical protein